MHPKVRGKVPTEGDGQMKRGRFLRLLQKFFLRMVGNSWAIGKLLSAAVIPITIMLVWEVPGVTHRDGNISFSTYSHQNGEEYGFAV